MKKIFIAGHNGMVGSAIYRHLKNTDVELIVAPREDCDLINQHQVKEFFHNNQFDQVYLAAAKVGGIHANNEYPADFIHQNLMIQSNVINSAYTSGVEKLLFLGSSCIYPKLANQPIDETELLNGYLEPTNEPYAIAKIAGIKMCESYNRQYNVDYRSVMPTNLYGPGDNYHPLNSHVVPALIQRFHHAVSNNIETIDIWGSGNVRREFLHVDDMAKAAIFIMNLKKEKYLKVTSPLMSHINIGSNSDVTIKELAMIISSIAGYKGETNWDTSKPDGPSRKLMSSKILNELGFHPSISLEEGLRKTYSSFTKELLQK